MKLTIKRLAAITATCALSAATLSACSGADTDKDKGADKTTSSSSTQASSETSSAAAAEKEGTCSPNEENHEILIGEDTVGPVDLAVHYFQPGQMMAGSKMLDYDKSAAHLEVDTTMNASGAKWGYANGETPAHMDIDYAIKDADGNDVDSGKLMEMNAADGSHYGINVAEGKMKDGKYTLELTVNHPTMYPLHKDLVTGVEADNWYDTQVASFEWDYKTPKKDANPVEDCDVPAAVIKPVLKAAENPDKDPAGKCDEPEINIGAAQAGPLDFDVNYFQPGGMLNEWLGIPTDMPTYQDSIAHLEADVKTTDANAEGSKIGYKGTDYGYKDGSTPANLQIKYSIVDPDGTVVDSGMFMEMNAKDGSHYGTNLKKDVPLVDGTKYTLKLDVAPPKDYSLHIDKRTGVKVRHWFKPFTIDMPWLYTGNQKACIVKPWEDAFPQPVPALEKKDAS